MRLRGGSMAAALPDTYDMDELDATATFYTSWYDCSGLAWVTTFQEAVYTNNSGATIDTTIEFKNERSGTAFDPSSAHAQLTNDGANHKNHTVIGGKFRLKITLGGTFGSGEEIALNLDYFGQSAA